MWVHFEEKTKHSCHTNIVDKIKRQFWHQFHPNPDGNIHKIRKYLFIIPQQMHAVSREIVAMVMPDEGGDLEKNSTEAKTAS